MRRRSDPRDVLELKQPWVPKRVVVLHWIRQILLGGLWLVMTSLSVSGEENIHQDNDGNGNNDIAEEFISAFYSWDATKLKNLMTEEIRLRFSITRAGPRLLTIR